MEYNRLNNDDGSLSLMNKKILVTGVTRPLGIGAAITRRCLLAGASVAVHGYPDYDVNMRYPDAALNSTTQLVHELSSQGFEIIGLPPSDLSGENEPESVIWEALRHFSYLNGLILNHAYSVSVPLEEWTAEHIDMHFKVNVRASMLMIKAFAEQIDPATGGVITLFTSGQYLGPMIPEIAYAVSKEAVRALCEQAAAALAPKNIRVNCINPGPTDTGYLQGQAYADVARMFPSGRWGTPDDAARLVQFLHSEQANWITGQTIASEGGFKRC